MGVILGSQHLGISKALIHLEKLGVVKERTSQKRNRLFSYTDYIEIMNRGTELP